MNFVLPGPNVKLLARTVNCFSKIGNELFFEATPDGLVLKTINSTNTAYAVAHFKQDFFISFQQGDKDTPDENCCKISVKPILKIFKSLATIITCKMWLDIAQSKIIFQFRCKSEVLKTHKIYLLESEHINSLNLAQTFPSEIVGNYKVFASILLHLHSSVDEVTFELKEDKAIVSNFVDNEQADRSTLRSTLAIDTAAFQSYQLEQRASLTFCYKEFKAVTMYASVNRFNLQMSFSKPGTPLMLQMNKPGVVHVKVIMGTMQPSPALHKRRMNRQNKSRQSAPNRSLQMDSEAINTLLTEDITHDSETSPNACTSNMRLNTTDNDGEFDCAREGNRQREMFNPKVKKTVQDVVNEQLERRLEHVDNCNVARSTRSELPAETNSVLERQRSNTDGHTLRNEPSSEIMFNTNTANFPFLDEINLPTGRNNNLDSIPGLTIGENQTTSAHPMELLRTESNTDTSEQVDSNSGSIFAPKRKISDSPRESFKRQKTPGNPATPKPATEFVPESPEAIEERKRKHAKLRHIFRRCFEPTFDPAMQPGCSQIFAANSDSDGES